MAIATFRTEESQTVCNQFWTPSGPFFVGSFSLFQKESQDKPLAQQGSAPNPGIPGSRKLSVPGRVHSILESYGSPQASLLGSNPFLTHGTVESSAKSVSSLPTSKRRTAAFQSHLQVLCPTLILAWQRLSYSCAVHASGNQWRTTASNQSFGLLANPVAG